MFYKRKVLIVSLVFLFLFPVVATTLSNELNSPIINLEQSINLNNTITDNIPIRQSISSEEEDIDSFDVNPKSGRWNTTETGSVDDRIIDGNLRLITTVNETDSSSKYFMQRGLQKTDAKIDYRYKALMDNSSQVEYFRDVLGDSADFEEGAESTLTCGAGDTCVYQNGINIETANRYADIITDIDIEDFGQVVYNDLLVRVKVSGFTNGWRLEGYVNKVPSGTHTFCSSDTFMDLDWVEVSCGISGLSKANVGSSWNDLSFYVYRVDESGTIVVKWDWIKLIGDLDYATHESSIGDTWDWGDSSEHFFDVLGNVSEFNDGTTEDWETDAGTLTNEVSEYLKFVRGASTTMDEIYRLGLSISSGTYKWLTFEFNSSVAITRIEIWDEIAGANLVCNDSTGWTADTWHLFSCSLSGDWIGTDTVIVIQIYHASADATYFLNMVYLYDTELGDRDTWEPIVGTNVFSFVDPSGFLVNRINLTSASPRIAPTPANGHSIDSSIFDTFIIKIKADSSSSRFFMLADNLGNQIISVTALTTSFQILSFDLSLDNDWSGIENGLRLHFYASSGKADPILFSIYTINYILLEASTGIEQDFVVGFWDPIEENVQALVNITHHFFNSTTFRWEIELYDSNQEIASFFYSSNQTVADVYYRVSIDYNILESEFKTTITTDSGTRIFKVVFGDEFTTTNDNPAIFAIEESPRLFLSTHTVFYGHQEVWIDFINAPYKEKDWQRRNSFCQSEAALANVTADTPLLMKTKGRVESCSESNSAWFLIIPHLDSLSGSVRLDDSNATFTGPTTSTSVISLFIFSVNKSTGDTNNFATRLFGFQIQKVSGQSTTGLQTFFKGSGFSADPVVASSGSFVQKANFAVTLSQDRSKAILDIRSWGDEDDDATIKDTIISFDLEDQSEPSQEYYVRIQYTMAVLHVDGIIISEFTEFDFVSRDIFQNIIKPVTDFFGGIFDFIAGIFIAIGLFFGFIIKVAMDALGVVFEVALETLGTLLEAAIQALEPFLTLIEQAVEAIGVIIQEVVDALAALAAEIWAAFEPLISNFLDIILGLLGIVFDAIIDAGQTVISAIFNWILGFLNLTEIADTSYQLFLLAVSLIFLVFLGIVFLGFSAPIVFARSVQDVAINYWNTWIFDITFGFSFIGIRLYIPFVVLLVGMIIAFGYQDLLLPDLPF
ncbi:hypothetical protein LCGC14_1086690 [marine sediment metagenome]|uniref:Uncharacterized protein n=1 Tax=marine sediment metagenome TaxID=412755 RepID=A0A0F9QJJ9_9ZZZZ